VSFLKENKGFSGLDRTRKAGAMQALALHFCFSLFTEKQDYALFYAEHDLMQHLEGLLSYAGLMF
jgi:hypothetical protein